MGTALSSKIMTEKPKSILDEKPAPRIVGHKARKMRSKLPAKTRHLKNLGGKPPTILDEVLLFDLAKTLLPVESIAAIMRCSPELITDKYAHILLRGREQQKHTLVQMCWYKAIHEKDTKMLIWLTKQHLGYKEQWPDNQQQTFIQINVNEVPSATNVHDIN